MKILVYPKDSNPYQQLLYSKFPKKITITYLTNLFLNHNLSLLLLPFQLILYRLKGYKIFHLHFVYTFRLIHFPYSTTLPFRIVMSIYFVLFISLIRILGFKLVWTTHDLIPHGNYFLNDLAMMRFLSYAANVKIVHSISSLKKMKECKMKINNCTIIPIGNYIGLYESNKKRDVHSRKNHKDEITFGFFGKIRADKGVIELLETYNSYKYPKSKLYIVGQCDEELSRTVNELSKKNKQVTTILGHIPDNEIYKYFDLFDVVVLPFKNITTSSSILLAMSLKKPVICPLIGEIVDIPHNTGIYYDPNNSDGLKESMSYAIKHKSLIKTMAINAYKYMKTLDWKKSSKLTLKLYNSLYTK